MTAAIVSSLLHRQQGAVGGNLPAPANQKIHIMDSGITPQLPADFRPLDPSGVSDRLHELRKRYKDILPASLDEALLDYETSRRLC